MRFYWLAIELARLDPDAFELRKTGCPGLEPWEAWARGLFGALLVGFWLILASFGSRWFLLPAVLLREAPFARGIASSTSSAPRRIRLAITVSRTARPRRVRRGLFLGPRVAEIDRAFARPTGSPGLGPGPF
jgi:hypothetical protein